MQLSHNQQQVTVEPISKPNDTELRAWADRLNVTKVQLKAAINAVGSSAKIVEAYLYRKQQSRQSS
ncbi:Protein of unknown function [Mucilaginibacter pineti]|uniref:DUF3606 domain-containing protein n=1 Tax=Mucilaginibacter pineti TaxID=1391627 RepID=A0A1G6Z9C8_9SPHI|nr:DUF3606 domain-containing protein [Mucilaginibacter pineti]SDD99289.1 Protein of unknown function [Mucilaginibacter pineti]